MAFFITIKRTIVRNGITTMKIQARLPPMINAITTEKISIIGQRNAVRTSIIYENCTLFTSVVIRVTSEGVENLSMFSNEKS